MRSELSSTQRAEMNLIKQIALREEGRRDGWRLKAIFANLRRSYVRKDYITILQALKANYRANPVLRQVAFFGICMMTDSKPELLRASGETDMADMLANDPQRFEQEYSQGAELVHKPVDPSQIGQFKLDD